MMKVEEKHKGRGRANKADAEQVCREQLAVEQCSNSEKEQTEN